VTTTEVTIGRKTPAPTQDNRDRKAEQKELKLRKQTRETIEARSGFGVRNTPLNQQRQSRTAQTIA